MIDAQCFALIGDPAVPPERRGGFHRHPCSDAWRQDLVTVSRILAAEQLPRWQRYHPNADVVGGQLEGGLERQLYLGARRHHDGLRTAGWIIQDVAAASGALG